jgi:hypothetical protein
MGAVLDTPGRKLYYYCILLLVNGDRLRLHKIYTSKTTIVTDASRVRVGNSDGPLPAFLIQSES